MNKINITAEKAQTMTAKEINALAQHILNRKGQVDFTGTSLAITPPDDMDADMAGIIVKCATENGGTLNISGATEISDEEWEVMMSKTAWLINFFNVEYISSIGDVTNAANAFDGNIDTLAYGSGTHSYIFGYSDNRVIANHLTLHCGVSDTYGDYDNISAFNIYGSLDKENWTLLKAVTGNTLNVVTCDLDIIEPFRYYKYEVTNGGGGWRRTRELSLEYTA